MYGEEVHKSLVPVCPGGCVVTPYVHAFVGCQYGTCPFGM